MDIYFYWIPNLLSNSKWIVDNMSSKYLYARPLISDHILVFFGLNLIEREYLIIKKYYTCCKIKNLDYRFMNLRKLINHKNVIISIKSKLNTQKETRFFM